MAIHFSNLIALSRLQRARSDSRYDLLANTFRNALERH